MFTVEEDENGITATITPDTTGVFVATLISEPDPQITDSISINQLGDTFTANFATSQSLDASNLDQATATTDIKTFFAEANNPNNPISARYTYNGNAVDVNYHESDNDFDVSIMDSEDKIILDINYMAETDDLAVMTEYDYPISINIVKS